MIKEESLLAEILKKRILILDGAMGTMIQDYELKESDFRGNLFIIINNEKHIKYNNTHQ